MRREKDSVRRKNGIVFRPTGCWRQEATEKEENAFEEDFPLMHLPKFMEGLEGHLRTRRRNNRFSLEKSLARLD